MTYKKFNQFTSICNIYHIDHCKYDSCDNCDFIINLEKIYFKDCPDELNGMEPLQNFCRKYHGNFFFLTSLLKILKAY